MIFREELKDVLYEPALKLVDELEKRKDMLEPEELMMLAKLRFSLAIYEIQKGAKSI